jgi:hypothetical protein
MGLNNPTLKQIQQQSWELAHLNGTKMTLHMCEHPVTDRENYYYYYYYYEAGEV